MKGIGWEPSKYSAIDSSLTEGKRPKTVLTF